MGAHHGQRCCSTVVSQRPPNDSPVLQACRWRRLCTRAVWWAARVGESYRVWSRADVRVELRIVRVASLVRVLVELRRGRANKGTLVDQIPVLQDALILLAQELDGRIAAIEEDAITHHLGHLGGGGVSSHWSLTTLEDVCTRRRYALRVSAVEQNVLVAQDSCSPEDHRTLRPQH